MNNPATLSDQPLFTEIPARYQRILDLLDGHVKGKTSDAAILAIDEEELRIARHLRRRQTNARMSALFPELDEFDEF